MRSTASRKPGALLRRALASSHLYWVLPLIVLALLAQSFDSGWLIDDHGHRAALIKDPDLPELHREPGELFAFLRADREEVLRQIDQGRWPWWTTPEPRLAFWRPVAGWSHALDYRLWPERPFLMHLHSALWYAGAVVLLLALYRRLLDSAAVAGLAALVYAVDDSQAWPALWLANRNSLIALAFGTVSLLAYDRWRREGWTPGACIAPAALLVAVLSNESAVAVGGYLLAYALFLDEGPWRRRLAALAPSAIVGIAWAAVYRASGYGAAGSPMYVDPTDLGRFLPRVAERAPTLLWGWWGPLPADAAQLASDGLRQLLWGLGLAFLGLLGWLLLPTLRESRTARFFALGMVLALVPACSTLPSNRLLAFVGLGAAGLLACLVRDLWARARASGFFGRSALRAVLGALLVIHLILPPLYTKSSFDQLQLLERLVRQTSASLPDGSGPQEIPLAESEIVIVSTPSAFLSIAADIVHALGDGPRPLRSRVLSSGIYGVRIERPDETSLILRPAGGYLRSAGAGPPPGVDHRGPPIDPRRGFLLLDGMFRDTENWPFHVGDTLELSDLTVETLEVQEGRPLAVAFRFSEPLEAPRWRWLIWRRGRYEPFAVPPVGGAVALPGVASASR